MNLPVIDMAALEQRIEARRAQRAALGQTKGFRPVSLSDWLDLCDLIDIPHVPGHLLGEAPLDAVLRFDELEGAGAAPFYADVEQHMAALGPGWMARWDCCSMAEIKAALSEGQPGWNPRFADLYADDVRAYDILTDFPGDRIKAWARPWLTFAQHNGWPVEYRAFVLNGQIMGVSNYYPQRTLEDWPEAQADVARVVALTKALVEGQDELIICPQIDLDPTLNHWTADFARLPSGAILFLEGGPPHTPRWGAHPCCFAIGEVGGVALRDRTGRFERDAVSPNPESEAGLDDPNPRTPDSFYMGYGRGGV